MSTLWRSSPSCLFLNDVVEWWYTTVCTYNNGTLIIFYPIEFSTIKSCFLTWNLIILLILDEITQQYLAAFHGKIIQMLAQYCSFKRSSYLPVNRGKLLFIFAVAFFTGSCGYLVYYEILSFEYLLYNTSYDSTTLQIHSSLDAGLSYNYLVTQDLANSIGIECPEASIWPNCS